MTKFALIWDNARHDLRGSDGRLAILTQAAMLFFLLTLTLTSVSIQDYLASNLDRMLGSDLVLESRDPLTKKVEMDLFARASKITKTELTPVTLTHANRWERVQLKLVDDTYPLQGELMIGTSPAAQQRSTTLGPENGEIWLGPRLATKLGAVIGDNLTLGDHRLRFSAILFHEPDRILEGHSVALRAMIHYSSINAASLVSSKWLNRYLIEADKANLKKIESWAKETLPATKIIKKHGGQHPLAGFMRRTENFLGLASVILFFMAAVAIDMTNRRWLSQVQYRLAIYSCFGTKLTTGIAMAGLQWMIGFILSLCLGILLAIGAQALIIAEMQSYFPGLTSGWHIGDALKTIAFVFCLLLALHIPVLVQLKHTSVLTLIRSAPLASHVWIRLSWGVAAVAALAAAYSDNLLLTGLTLCAIGAALLLMIILTWLVLNLGDVWGRRRSGFLPFTFFIMKRRIFAKSAQILGLSLCALLLLFTMMLMRDLGTMMEGYGRTHDGNLVISEAQADQIDAIKLWSDQTGSNIRAMRPFVSAQLIKVNDMLLAEYIEKPSDTLSAVQSPIRLSWADEIPKNNKLSGGTWWRQGTKQWQQISTEPEVMSDLGFSYGDMLTYQINGQAYIFELVASHSYQPGSGSITFWFQVPNSARDQISAKTRFMGSMELPESAWPKLGALWQKYPTLSLAPLKELTERFDKTLALVTKLTAGFSGMVLLLALFVLAASINGFQADDRQKNGLLMSMGLRLKDCLRLNLYEWAITAMIAAVGAIAGTWAAGYLIYQSQFGLTYNPDITWVLGTVIAMVASVCTVGLLNCRQNLKTSVSELLTTN